MSAATAHHLECSAAWEGVFNGRLCIATGLCPYQYQLRTVNGRVYTDYCHVMEQPRKTSAMRRQELGRCGRGHQPYQIRKPRAEKRVLRMPGRLPSARARLPSVPTKVRYPIRLRDASFDIRSSTHQPGQCNLDEHDLSPDVLFLLV